MYLAILSPTMCIATLGVCVLLWAITIVYGAYARRTQRVLLDTLAAGNQVCWLPQPCTHAGLLPSV